MTPAVNLILLNSKPKEVLFRKRFANALLINIAKSPQLSQTYRYLELLWINSFLYALLYDSVCYEATLFAAKPISKE